MRKSTSLVTALMFSAGILVSVTSATAANPNCSATDGDYIVTFTRASNVQSELRSAPGKEIAPGYIFDTVLNGFAANLSAEQVCAFRKRPNIEFLEPDQTISADVTEQSAPSTIWGLDRIDNQSLPLDNKYKYTTQGSNVTAYVVDTGIYSKHSDISGRVLPGYSAVTGSKSTEDCNGHGTHVAGTIGGTVYGVAKSVKLVPVRVLSCNGSGTNSGVISGLNWIAKNNKSSLAVANMSLGGGVSSTLDAAVSNLINLGVVVVVAAGNSAADACNSSPARVPAAITVAASDSSDKFASFSNWGKCVDIIAPGVNITSLGSKSTTATATMSGTSMATPHVAGAIARLLTGNSGIDVVSKATLDKVSSVPIGTVNKLLYLDSAN